MEHLDSILGGLGGIALGWVIIQLDLMRRRRKH